MAPPTLEYLPPTWSDWSACGPLAPGDAYPHPDPAFPAAGDAFHSGDYRWV